MNAVDRFNIENHVRHRCCSYTHSSIESLVIRRGFNQSFYDVRVSKGWRTYGPNSYSFPKAIHRARLAPNHLVLQRWIDTLRERGCNVKGLALASRVMHREGSTVVHQVKVARRAGLPFHFRYEMVLVAVEEGVDAAGTGSTIDAACRDLRRAAIVAIANDLPTA